MESFDETNTNANRFEYLRKRLIHLHEKRNSDCVLSVRGKELEKSVCAVSILTGNIYQDPRSVWHLVLSDWDKKDAAKLNGQNFDCKKLGKILDSGCGEKMPESKADIIKKLTEDLKSSLFIFQLTANKKIYFTLCDEEKKNKMVASKTDEEVKSYGKILYSSMHNDPPEALWDVIENGYFGLKTGVTPGDLTEKFTEMARKGDVAKLRVFLANVSNINLTDGNGWTMLHHAAYYGNVDFIHALLTLKADTEVRDTICGRTAIHIAAREGKAAVVELLLNAGSSINDTDKSGWTPLHYAAWRGAPQTVKYLISRNANADARELSVGKKPIHVAVTEGHTHIVEIFLDNCADINDVDSEGRTLLYYSAFAGRFETAVFLTGKNADINLKNEWGVKPLHICTVFDCVKVAELLLNRGCDIESMDNKGWTPLHWAGYDGAIELYQFFVEKGASLSVKDKKGNTPFDLAMSHQKLETVSCIAEIMVKKLQDEAKYEEVLKIYEKLFEMQKNKLGEDDSETLKTHSCIGVILSKLERYELSMDTLKLVFNKTQSGGFNFAASCTQLEMGRVYLAQWKLAEAMQTFKEVYNIWQDSLGTSDSRTLGVAREIAYVHFNNQEYDEASKLFEDIYKKRKLCSGANDPETLQALQDVAMALAHKGENRKALGFFKEVLAKRKDILGADHPDTRIVDEHILMVEKRMENSSIEEWSCCLL